MELTLIGAGRVALSLGPALQRAGHTVLQVYSRTEPAARLLASRLRCPYATRLTDLRPTPVCLIAVADSALPEVAQACAAVAPLLIHTAGSMPLATLPTARRAVLYPMQTFSKERQVDFHDVSLFLEASDSDTLAAVSALARTLSPRVYTLDGEGRRRLHLAAVFACNFANHLYTLAADILQPARIPFDALLPLIDETTRKLHTLAPAAAQTGPAARRDHNVIAAQQALLASRPDLQYIYKVLTQSILTHD